jgi:2-keto-4-pentenoate hydratase/2-oxohepta-3-ene-1,7-dioic acid hydratase in catechol pathway
MRGSPLSSAAMKIFRFESTNGDVLFGTGEKAAPGDVLEVLDGELFGGFVDTGEKASVARVLAPLEPRAILCIGLNYRQHAAETNAALPEFPVLFAKNPASVQHPGEPIVLPRWLRSGKVDYECELAVVIRKAARNVPRARALQYVLGYTCANDVSARDWQKEGGGGQWCRGKSFDTFCPLGPCLATPESIPNPNALKISTRVGSEVLQESNTSDMIFDIPTLIEFLSGSTTLLPGTVILTGTPSGVGMARKPPRWLQPGEQVTIAIEGIGELTNPIVEEEAAGASEFALPQG